RQQVDFVHQQDGTNLEHERVLNRFVIPFGDAQNHDLFMLTQVEFGRAHQVSDVFDYEQIDPGEVQRLQRNLNHVAVEMTSPIGIDLHGLDAFFLYAFGVIGRLEVAFDDRNSDPGGERFDGFLQK